MFSPCREFNNGVEMAMSNGGVYEPCKDKKGVSSILCKIKNGLCYVTRSIRKSWKLQFLIVFALVLLITNAFLIATDNYNVTSEGQSVLTNSLYLSTTQLTTIGYGDVIPSTNIAKWFSSFVHVVILFMTLGLAEEFGAVTVATENQSTAIKTELNKGFKPYEDIFAVTQGLQRKKTLSDLNIDPSSLPTQDPEIIKKLDLTLPGVQRARTKLMSIRDRNNQRVAADSVTEIDETEDVVTEIS